MNFFDTFLSNYISDPKWYPYILLGLGIFVLLIIYIIFMYIRSFISWIFGINEMVRLQKEQNYLLRELLAIQEEQREILESLFVENNSENAEEISEDENEGSQESEENSDQNDDSHEKNKKK